MKTNYLKTLITFLFFIFGHSVYAQYFFKTYDLPPFNTSSDIGYSIDRNFSGTLSGGWSVAGVSNSTPNAGSFDWMYLRLTTTGTLKCAMLLGFPLSDSCFSHVQLEDAVKRNVLAGFYRAPNGREKASFSLIDTACTHFISKQISDSLRHEYRQVVKNTANVFTITGYIQHFYSPTEYRDHILASQYTPDGTLVWAFNYLPPYSWINERAFSICYQPYDGSYAITGYTNRFTGSTGPYQVFIMKVTAAGIPVWFKGYSPMTGTPSESRRIVALPDGGFAVTGWSSAFDASNDIYVFRVTGAGAVVWSNTYGMPMTTEQSYSMIYQSSDASLVITGYSRPTGGNEDIILLKLASAGGAFIWQKRFPNVPGDDRGFDLKEASSPAGYSVTGKLVFSTNTSPDAVFLRTNAFGNVTPTCQDSTMIQPRPSSWTGDCARNIMQLHDTPVQPQVVSKSPSIREFCVPTGINGNNSIIPEGFKLMQNYPNPFNPSTIIQYGIPVSGNVKLTVYNAAGEVVTKLVDNYKQAGHYQVVFEASVHSSGVYFYKLETNEFTETKKMLMIK